MYQEPAGKIMDESEGEQGKGGGASSRILTWWTELSLFMVAMN